MTHQASISDRFVRIVLVGIVIFAAVNLMINVGVFMHLFVESHEAFAGTEDIAIWMWIVDTVLWTALFVSTIWLVRS